MMDFASDSPDAPGNDWDQASQDHSRNGDPQTNSAGDLSFLMEIASAINSTMPVEEINKLVIQKCIVRMGAEQGAIHLLKQASSSSLRTFVRAYDASKHTAPFRPSLPLIGWIIKHKTALLSNDLPGDERFAGMELNRFEVKSVLSVPLTFKGDPIGFLSLFNKTSAGGFTPEDQRLLSIIATQCGQVIEMARLYTQTQQLADREAELEEARHILRQLMPQAPLVSQGVTLAGYNQSAEHVGGDYYGYIGLGSERWGVSVADVTGHGLAAALMMSDLQATLRASAHLTAGVRECVAAVNHLMTDVRNLDDLKLATLFYGVLNTSNRSLTYTNAGHNPPMLFRADGIVEELYVGGLMLGVLENAAYEQATVTLHPGDLLLIYTDGITEAMNAEEEPYGESRLRDSVLRHRALGAAELLESLVADMAKHRRGEMIQDDITLVAIKIS